MLAAVKKDIDSGGNPVAKGLRILTSQWSRPHLGATCPRRRPVRDEENDETVSTASHVNTLMKQL